MALDGLFAPHGRVRLGAYPYRCNLISRLSKQRLREAGLAGYWSLQETERKLSILRYPQIFRSCLMRLTFSCPTDLANLQRATYFVHIQLEASTSSSSSEQVSDTPREVQLGTCLIATTAIAMPSRPRPSFLAQKVNKSQPCARDGVLVVAADRRPTCPA